MRSASHHHNPSSTTTTRAIRYLRDSPAANELVALARIVGEYPGTLYRVHRAEPHPAHRTSLARSHGRYVARGGSLAQLEQSGRQIGFCGCCHADVARDTDGFGQRGKVVPLSYPAASTFYFTLASSAPFGGLPGWGPLIGMTLKERTAVFADSAAATAPGSRRTIRGSRRAAWDASRPGVRTLWWRRSVRRTGSTREEPLVILLPSWARIRLT